MGAQWKAKGKAQAADARGKLFGRLAKDIMVAARNGADPATQFEAAAGGGAGAQGVHAQGHAGPGHQERRRAHRRGGAISSA